MIVQEVIIGRVFNIEVQELKGDMVKLELEGVGPLWLRVGDHIRVTLSRPKQEG